MIKNIGTKVLPTREILTNLADHQSPMIVNVTRGDEEASGILRFRLNEALQEEISKIAGFTHASRPELLRQWFREKVELYTSKPEYRKFLNKRIQLTGAKS